MWNFLLNYEGSTTLFSISVLLHCVSNWESCKFCLSWFISQSDFAVYWTVVNLAMWLLFNRKGQREHTFWFIDASEKWWDISMGYGCIGKCTWDEKSACLPRALLEFIFKLSSWHLASPECGKHLTLGRTMKKDLLI